MKNKKQQLGFSLMEIMVVASVVMIAFIAILVLAEKTIQFRTINQKALIAAQLAQEGLELARFYRNDNWLAGRNFNVNINYYQGGRDNETGDTYILALDYTNRTTVAKNSLLFYSYYDGLAREEISGLGCSGQPDPLICYLKTSQARLYRDTADNNFYKINKDPGSGVPASYQDSGFSRLIKTVYYDSGTSDLQDDYVYVICKVYWQDRGKDFVYSTATYLYDYDWYY